MSKLADRMTKKLNTLPPGEQDVIASCVLDMLVGSTPEEETEWETLVNTPESHAWLEEQSKKILCSVTINLSGR